MMRGGSVIAVAIIIMNVASYGYTMVAARLLGPGSYGAFAALMNLLLVVSVASLGLQATAARRISAEPERVSQIEAEVLVMTRRAALALGLALILLSPVINTVLRLDSLATAALVGVIAVPLTMMGGQAGVLQGERRWHALGWVYVAAGVPRIVVGTALLLWQPSETFATIGVLVGALVPVVVGSYALRDVRDELAPSETQETRTILRESLANSSALLAFFAVSNVDIIVARNVLTDHESGLYAAGIIMTKAVLFLPQFVVVVAFPSMSTAHERRFALTRSLVMVAALGSAVVAGAFVLRDLAMVFVGGPEYDEIRDLLWLFAVLGTLLAVLQLLVYSVLARQGRRSIYLVWLGLPAVLVGGAFADTTTQLLTWVLAVDAVLVAGLLAASLVLVGRPEAAGDVPAEDHRGS